MIRSRRKSRRYNQRALLTVAERRMLPCERKRLAVARKAGFSTRFPYDFRYDLIRAKLQNVSDTRYKHLQVQYLHSCSVRSYATVQTNYDGKSSKKAVLFARNIRREFLRYGYSEFSHVYQLFFYIHKDRYKNQKQDMISVGKELIHASYHIPYYFQILGAGKNDVTLGQPGAGVNDEDEEKGGNLRAKIYKKYILKNRTKLAYVSDLSYKTHTQVMKYYWRFL